MGNFGLVPKIENNGGAKGGREGGRPKEEEEERKQTSIFIDRVYGVRFRELVVYLRNLRAVFHSVEAQKTPPIH